MARDNYFSNVTSPDETDNYGWNEANNDLDDNNYLAIITSQ